MTQRRDQRIPKYTSIGSYPLFMYRTVVVKGLLRRESSLRIYCPDCANQLEAEPDDVVDVNWENPALYCSACRKRIESAYAEDQVQRGRKEATDD